MRDMLVHRLMAASFLLVCLDLGAQAPQAIPAESAPPAAIEATPVASSAGARAVVNLQTTVTGNQEQPRVLHILPWQSPPASEINFELLDGQETSVFSHLERIELRRQLESAGEFD